MSTIINFSFVLPGWVLLLAAFGKVVNFGKFTNAIQDYRILPGRINSLAAFLIVAAEATVGLAVVFGQLLPFSAYSAALVLTLFSSAMAFNLMKGRTDLACGCLSGSARMKISWRAVARNSFLSALALMSVSGDAFAPNVSALTSIVLLVFFIATVVQDFRTGHPHAKDMADAFYTLNGASPSGEEVQ